MSSIIAVIDIGTNTTRLLVRDTAQPTQDLSRIVRITRLGHDLEKTGRLGDDGIAQTTAAVLEYVEIAQSSGADTSTIFIFATAGARAATNGAEFILGLQNKTGCTATIISGEKEGQCAFAGAISGITGDAKPSVIFDIGGGSTEFAISSQTDPSVCGEVVSIPVGSVRITKRHLQSDPPKPEELTNAISDVRDYLKDVEAQIPAIKEPHKWIGVAATVTTAASVELGLKQFDVSRIHEMVLTKTQAEEIFRTLATESYADRIHNPGLEKERADVIVGGIAVMVAIMRHFELAEITVSCTDLLDGLYLSMLSR